MADRTTIGNVTGLILVLLIIGAFVLGLAHMEARAYNRITGGDVTTWEAVWVRLRVDCRGGTP